MKNTITIKVGSAFFALLLALVSFNQLNGQYFQSKNYPQGYFRNPLGIPLQLSANFGELRANHYHMGLDIRTNQRENLPVYAAAEGFISRVKIERYGFGRAIYITHPNGYTTLYAHLNNFYPALHQFVIDRQYSDEQWEQDLAFPENQFKVSKGQIIAYSGNTGGSAGPHLHFEIRDTETENLYNPWLFGFGLADYIKPYLYNFYYYDRRYSTYQVGPTPIKIKGGAGNYQSVDSVVLLSTPIISFGLSAEDKTNVSPFKFGIYQAEVWVDDSLVSGFQLDDISYDDSRYINAGIDYKTKINTGRYIQHLSRLPGNKIKVFAEGTGDGVITITDTAVHQATILIKDVAGNASTLKFRFKYNSPAIRRTSYSTSSATFLPNRQNEIKTADLSVRFAKTAFYDTVPFTYTAIRATSPRIVSTAYQLHNSTVPVHDSFTVRLKPSRQLEGNLKDKVIMQLVTPDKTVAAKGTWQGDELEAKFWDLGKVQLIIDTIPPTIIANFKSGANLRSKNSISFTVKDDAGEIKSFRATLDGRWLLFSRKSYAFRHVFDEKTSVGTHELKVEVEDEAGNLTEKNFTFMK